MKKHAISQLIHAFVLGMFLIANTTYPLLVSAEETASTEESATQSEQTETESTNQTEATDSGYSSATTEESTESSASTEESATTSSEESGEGYAEESATTSEASSSETMNSSESETESSSQESVTITTDISEEEHISEVVSEEKSGSVESTETTTYTETDQEETLEETTEEVVDTEGKRENVENPDSTTENEEVTTVDQENPEEDTGNDTEILPQTKENSEEKITETKITTGESIAFTNVLNIINSNFINSKGSMVFLNAFENLGGLIDLREYYGDAGKPQTCATSTCAGSNLNVTTDNDAALENNIDVVANSGANTIEDSETGEITTGDAFALANATNVVNTNFVDTSYLMVTVNTLGDLEGDLVLPSLDPLIGSFLEPVKTAESILKLHPQSEKDTSGETSGDSTIEITNDADINDDIAVVAESGNNSAETADGTSEITTGNSTAFANVFNSINTNFINQDKVTIIFRVHGEMAGNIYTPDNVVWVEEPDGSISFFQTDSSSTNGPGAYALPNATINNQAKISNNVSVVALTGENHISAAESAMINTGTAYAGANITNVANTNVIGGNWIFAIINILGDFKGNLTFGSPDLWVGEQIESNGDVMNDSELTYRFTVINNGDTSAKDVVFTDDFDENHLQILDSSHAYTVQNDGTIVWDPIDKIDPQEALEITYTAKVKNVDDYVPTSITNTATIGSNYETNTTLLDNTDSATIVTNAFVHTGEGAPLYQNIPVAYVTEESGGSESQEPAELRIVRVTEEYYLDGSERKAHQMIVLKNESNVDSGTVMVKDILRDPNGLSVAEQYWNLGKIYANEEIILSYDIEFNPDALPGQYEFLFFVEGQNYKLADSGITRGYVHLDGVLSSASQEQSDTPITTSGNTVNREGKKNSFPETLTDAMLPGKVLAAETSFIEDNITDGNTANKSMLAIISLLLILAIGMYVHRVTTERL